MKKKLLALFLLPVFLLGSCESSTSLATPSNEEEQVYTIPPYTPPTPPEQPKNIKAIDIIGIPEEIAIGEFDEANIRCQITYTDDTTYTFQLLVENLPNDIVLTLGNEGEHTFYIQINNVKKPITVNMVDTGERRLVRFLNYNYDVLYTTKVIPYNKVTYGADEPRRISDVTYKYIFSGWDFDIEHDPILENTDIFAQYGPVFKNNDYLPLYDGPQLVAEHKGELPAIYSSFECNTACYYVGRMSNVPIARFVGSEFTSHTHGNSEVIDYTFGESDSPIDPEYNQYYDYHPKMQFTLPYLYNASYFYSQEHKEQIDDKYVPLSPDMLNFASISGLPLDIEPIRARNIEGKYYMTAVNDFVDIIEAYLAVDKIGRLSIPEEYPDGKYNASLFVDLDLYTFVFAENRGNGDIRKSAIFTIACVADIYIGLNHYELRVEEHQTSTYLLDKMEIEMFAEMMKYARSAYEEE